VLPYDYETYGKEITVYIEAAKKKAQLSFGNRTPDFAAAADAARHFTEAGTKIAEKQRKAPENAAQLNDALLGAEHALLLPEGLPNRPWYRHSIYAPGQYTGYAAVVIPGVNEAISAKDLDRTTTQLAALTAALNRATKTLSAYH